MAYELIWEEKGVHWIFSGAFTDDDIINCNNEVFKDPRFPAITYEICNFIDVESFPISSEAIRVGAENDARAYSINPNIKVAVVATESVMKGLTNMYRIYMELAGEVDSWDTEIFETIEQSRKWVNA